MAISRYTSFIVLLAFCFTDCGALVGMFGQEAPVKSAASAFANLNSIIEEREEAVWKSFKNKDQKAFSELLADEYTGVFVDGQGEHDKQSAVDSMSQISILTYSLREFKLTPLGANAALLTYNASGSYLSGGKSQGLKLAVGDIWVKRGAKWKSLRYQETETK